MYTDDGCQSILHTLLSPFREIVDNQPEFAYYVTIMSSDAAPSIRLPPECETALLERFLKAEAMALWILAAIDRRFTTAGLLKDR